jgi:hypothetical protein
MKKKFLVAFAVAMIAAGSMAQATIIKAITATTVGTVFSNLTGILTMNGVTGIEVQDTADIVNTYGGGSFSLSTNLVSDTSSGGIARGNFAGGIFSYKDASNTVLLSGSIGSFSLIELYNGSGIFGGDGYFTVTGGTLQAAFGTASGSMVDISFSVQPKTISSFSTGFTASSNMTVLPVVPEPITLGFLSLGSLVILRKRKHG